MIKDKPRPESAINVNEPENICEKGIVTWFSSDGEGYDCGLSVGLGGGAYLYVGELANCTSTAHGLTPQQWGIVLYRAEAEPIYLGSTSPQIDQYDVSELIGLVSVALKDQPHD